MGFPLAVSYFLGVDATRAFDHALLSPARPAAAVAADARVARPAAARRLLLVALTWIVTPIFGAIPLASYLPSTLGRGRVFRGGVGADRDRRDDSARARHAADLGEPVSHVHALDRRHGRHRARRRDPAAVGIGGRQFQAEVPTPKKESSLTPRITETRKACG